MTPTVRVEQQAKAPPWRASCAACGGHVATVYGGGSKIEGRCFNWRVHRELAPDRKCPMYGKFQWIRKS